jgi:hypothetical protein
MPPAPENPPEPSALRRAFESTRPLDWGENAFTASDIARLHGIDATRRSLLLLEHAVNVEPAVTNQFLDSLPAATTAYQLGRRVKSPESLARKLADWEHADNPFPIDDLLRYTVLTESPDHLVAAARRTVDALNDHDWRVKYAMHSYTEGSRYKGLHANLAVEGAPRVEVQFHSVASSKVKELTTSWYEVERNANATWEERAEARQRCVAASETLKPPKGIDGLTNLGGRRVAVKNYSDSRNAVGGQDGRTPGSESRARQATTLDRTDGISR